jgi:hypothetical protein
MTEALDDVCATFGGTDVTAVRPARGADMAAVRRALGDDADLLREAHAFSLAQGNGQANAALAFKLGQVARSLQTLLLLPAFREDELAKTLAAQARDAGKTR